MELKKIDLKNKHYNVILNTCKLMVRRLYKDYEFLSINKDEFDKIVVSEIEESKKHYDEKELYSIYLKRKTEDRLNAYIKEATDDDKKIIKIINNYINIFFKDNKTDEYLMYYLTKLDELFVSIDYIPNPDVMIELIKNKKLKEVIELCIKHNLTNNKKYRDGVKLLIDTFKEMYNQEDNYQEQYIVPKYDDNFNTDGLKSYFNEISNIPPLTPKEEIEYGYKMLDGDTLARDILIRHNLKLVVNIAKKYIGLGVSLWDMIQDGNEGLIMAVSKFDPSKGCLFNTYAGWWIRHTILKGVALNRKSIKVSYNSYIKLSKYYQEYNKLRNELNHEPTDREIASALNITLEELKEIKSFELEVISLNVPIGSKKEDELSSIIESAELPIDERVMMMSLPRDLQRLFKKCELNDREIKLLSLRYGLCGDDPITLQEIGEILGGISRERTRQLESRALMKIRNSPYVEEFAIYMNNPNRAIDNIKKYRKLYKESELNTYKTLLSDDSRIGYTYNNVVGDNKKRKMIRE